MRSVRARDTKRGYLNTPPRAPTFSRTQLQVCFGVLPRDACFPTSSFRNEYRSGTNTVCFNDKELCCNTPGSRSITYIATTHRLAFRRDKARRKMLNGLSPRHQVSAALLYASVAILPSVIDESLEPTSLLESCGTGLKPQPNARRPGLRSP